MFGEATAQIRCQTLCSIKFNYSVALARAARAYGARNPCLSPIVIYLRSVPAATKPAILIMTSFATEAGPWALATPSVTDARTSYGL